MYIGDQYYVYVIRHRVIQWGIDSRLPTATVARAPLPFGRASDGLNWILFVLIYLN